MLSFWIHDQLIVPFACKKWEIGNIRISSVSTTGTHFVSDTPVVHISKSEKRSVTICDLPHLLPDEPMMIEVADDEPMSSQVEKAWAVLRQKLISLPAIDTDSERKFLDLYFSYIVKETTPPAWVMKLPEEERPYPFDNAEWRFGALLPLPQAHLYLYNSLRENTVMRKVDFAFWTGERFIAVEIDGSSHVGSEDHIRKDRELQKAGVEVIHILNSELVQYGEKVIRLLPSEIIGFWNRYPRPMEKDEYPIHPFANYYFADPTKKYTL